MGNVIESAVQQLAAVDMQMLRALYEYHRRDGVELSGDELALRYQQFAKSLSIVSRGAHDSVDGDKCTCCGGEGRRMVSRRSTPLREHGRTDTIPCMRARTWPAAESGEHPVTAKAKRSRERERSISPGAYSLRAPRIPAELLGQIPQSASLAASRAR